MSSIDQSWETRGAAWAFERYCALRGRVPAATFPAAPEEVEGLGPLLDRFDAFVFDAFGVLNVGPFPIAGSVDRISQLREAGRRVYVLTNAASVVLAELPSKFEGLGFDFTADEIVSSRQVLIERMRKLADGAVWGAIAIENSSLDDIPVPIEHYDEAAFARYGGIVFLASPDWNDERNADLIRRLAAKPLPILVGNPDLVAPVGDVFTVQPGAHAHEIQDHTGIEVEFFGKPFGNAFDAVKRKLGPDIDGSRVLMIGDTLHTDIIGGAAAGFKTALVTGHGLLKGFDIAACIDRSGVVPDYVMPSI